MCHPSYPNPPSQHPPAPPRHTPYCTNRQNAHTQHPLARARLCALTARHDHASANANAVAAARATAAPTLPASVAAGEFSSAIHFSLLAS